MHPPIRSILKDWMLPISMLGGVLFYQWIGYLTFLSPYLIFMMLTITYCRVKPSEFKIENFQWILLTAQMLLAVLVLCLLMPFNHSVATGVFICIFVPTATAAPVITGMLGGSITRVIAYSIVSNLTVALAGPAILAAIGENPNMTFLQSFYKICATILPLLLLPIITALIMRYTWPKAYKTLANNQTISFYLWAIALFIVVGSSVSFIIKNFELSKMPEISALIVGSMAACGLQFLIGRKIGGYFNDKVTGGQILGQKNTVLAIWLALSYLNPIASIAPAAYVAWHNIVNSYQIIHYHHRNQHTKNSQKALK